MAMVDLLLPVQEKRTALRLQYRDQMADDDHCFRFPGVRTARRKRRGDHRQRREVPPLHLKAAIAAGCTLCGEVASIVETHGPGSLRGGRTEGAVRASQSRYHPGYREMARVQDGAIGDIVAIQETRLRPPHVLYPRRPEVRGALSGQQSILFTG